MANIYLSSCKISLTLLYQKSIFSKDENESTEYTNITIFEPLIKIFVIALYFSWPIVSHKFNLYKTSFLIISFVENEELNVLSLSGSNLLFIYISVYYTRFSNTCIT